MASKFKLKIVVPDRLFYDAEVDRLIFKSSEGELGVQAGHIPLTTSVMPHLITIHAGDEKLQAVIHEGFAQILPEQVTIITDAAEWPNEIDLSRAESARQRAELQLEKADNDDIHKAKASLMRALARLQVGSNK